MADNIRELPELQVFRSVLFHCVVIIILPILSFFTSKVFFFDGLLGLNSIPSNVSAAAVSIIVLHIALGMFIYRAYFDTSKKLSKKD